MNALQKDDRRAMPPDAQHFRHVVPLDQVRRVRLGDGLFPSRVEPDQNDERSGRDDGPFERWSGCRPSHDSARERKKKAAKRC